MNNIRDMHFMASPHEVSFQVEHLLAQIPDVPSLIEPENEHSIISTEDPMQMMGLPLAWFAATDGKHAVRVNRMLVGLHLVNCGDVSHFSEIGSMTRSVCRRLVAALMQRLEKVDAHDAEIDEFIPSTPSPATVVVRMDQLVAAARKLNTTPRALVANILGRTLH